MSTVINIEEEGCICKILITQQCVIMTWIRTQELSFLKITLNVYEGYKCEHQLTTRLFVLSLRETKLDQLSSYN
ncbi:unnamed protein product, partial [Schistosoma haematobium]